MFYSHQILGRKGPLATVWCAAHLQHRLKKSHYTSTDISSTVDCIMFPPVAIALRMSGHLLLGVVRIYSKKVEYLHKDCNLALVELRKAFAPVDVNLPEDASTAPPDSVTLPEKFELDALDFDVNFDQQGAQDHHLKSHEDITLADQFPPGWDPYIAITFDEDTATASLQLQGSSLGLKQIDGDLHPADSSMGPHDRSNQINFHNGGLPESLVKPVGEEPQLVFPVDGSNEGIPPQNLPEREQRRNAVHDISTDSKLMWQVDVDVNEPPQPAEQSMIEREIPFSDMGNILVSGGPSLNFQQHSEPPAFTASDKAPSTFGSIHHKLASRPSSPVVQPKPKRKRRHLYDETTVLTNKFMKKALQDSKDLLRKRKNAPCSLLGVWKLKKRARKEQMFSKSLIDGLCTDLQNIFNKDFISSRTHVVVEENASSPVLEADVEIELLRQREGDTGIDISPKYGPSPLARPSSPVERVDGTPITASNVESGSEFQARTTASARTFPASDLGESTGHFTSDVETPVTFLGERSGLDSNGLSDIPELRESPGPEELSFLEADNNTPIGSQGTRTADTLSVRTRAVAQYLKRYSPISDITDRESEDFSLNNILEGKSRKLSARMFFEMLVLKSYELVDLQQEEPYGDITLKLTSTFKAHF